MRKTREWFAVCAATLLCLSGASALDVVVSNLGSATEGGEILSSSSDPLPLGSAIRLVALPGLNDTELLDLVEQGPEVLLEASEVIGSGSIGSGEDALEGQVEFMLATELEIAAGDCYLVAFNEGEPVDSSEMLVLRLPGEIPVDDVGGIQGFYSVHLGEASVVFGSSDESDFLTQARSTASFGEWIETSLGDGALPSELTETADPDGDGQNNLLEYALGSDPGLAGSIGSIQIVSGHAGTALRFPKRLNEPRLIYQAEQSSNLLTWVDLESAVTVSADEAPVGFEWNEQVLTSGSRSFVRLKVELED